MRDIINDFLSNFEVNNPYYTYFSLFGQRPTHIYDVFIYKDYFIYKRSPEFISLTSLEREGLCTITFNDFRKFECYSSLFVVEGQFHLDYYVIYKNILVEIDFCIDNLCNERVISGFKILGNSENIISIFNELLKYKECFHTKNKEKIQNCKYITITSNGEFTSNLLILKENYNVNLNKCFNDDLPNIDPFINKDSCGLALLHGIPGCGKTTYIKNIIAKYDKKEFYILDASLLASITSSSFLEYLFRKTNSIFILEDCEELLKDRNVQDNPWVGTLLNLTDGMLGETLSIKFICTFNCDLSSIDKALLRKGRLDILYEFKPLCKEKSKIICEERGIECTGAMTLADLYKTNIANSSINKSKTKIGF